MGYAALTAFLNDGKLPEPSIEDLAKRLMHFDFKEHGIEIKGYHEADDGTAQDRAAALIAKLIHQEIERAMLKAQEAEKDQ